jgi:hypothetical protein
VSKSAPGTVLPRSPEMIALRSGRPFRSLLTPYREREQSPSVDPLRRCQPAGVRQSRPARSKASSASPDRSFLTPRESRSLARVRVAPWRKRSSTRSSRPRCPLSIPSFVEPPLKLPDDLKMGGVGVGGHQLQIDRCRGRRCAVLAGEDQMFLRSPEIEVRVAEGMDITIHSRYASGQSTATHRPEPVDSDHARTAVLLGMRPRIRHNALAHALTASHSPIIVRQRQL